MAIVSFWSDNKRETGKTSSIAAIATNMAMNNTYKMLIFDTAYNNSSLQECFIKNKKSKKINFGTQQNIVGLDTGIKGVTKAILSNKTSPEIITNYTQTIFKNRLEILTGTDELEDEYIKQRGTFKEIVKMANKFYNLVFVDLAGDTRDSAEREILEMSDIIVVNLNQNIKSFNNYLNLRKNGMFANKKNLILLMGRADLDSKYNAKNLSRVIMEKDIYAIPYATQFFEATGEGTVDEYFIKFSSKKYEDINTKFIECTNKISERILEKIKELQMGI